MAKITVRYELSEEYRKSVLVATGERLQTKQELEIELADISPEQRQIFVALAGLSDAVDVSNHSLVNQWSSANSVWFDAPLTVETATKAAHAKLAAWKVLKEKDAQEKAEYSRKTAERIEREREEKRRQDADRERREADRERREAEREAAKAQAEADKMAWVNVHGSDHLRTAVNAGYDCTRLYITERAALEHPGYVVDFDDAAEWKSRSCPSPTALAEALSVDGEVVWLTHPARKDRPDDWEEWENCEAVVISGYQGKHDLVRTI